MQIKHIFKYFIFGCLQAFFGIVIFSILILGVPKVQGKNAKLKVVLNGKLSKNIRITKFKALSSSTGQIKSLKPYLMRFVAPVSEKWQKYSFSFLPRESGRIQIVFRVPISRTSLNWIFYDNIKLAGAHISNGDFEYLSNHKAIYWIMKPGQIIFGKKFSQSGNNSVLSNPSKAISQLIFVKANKKVTVTFYAKFAFSGEKIPSFMPVKYVDKWFDNYRPTKTWQNLAGKWDYHKAKKDFALPFPKGKWGKVYLPANNPLKKLPNGGDFNWFKRSFKLSAALKQKINNGEQIILYTEGLGLRNQLYLNGKKLINAWMGLSPKKVNITKILKIDDVNNIIIGNCGRNGLMAKSATKADFKSTRPRNVLIAPCGGVGTAWNNGPIIGVWGNIELWARPAKRIEDVFVKTSFREKTIEFDIETSSTKDTVVSIEIKNKRNETVLALNDTAPTNKSYFNLKKAWNNPELWEPGSPYLYSAYISLKDSNGEILDQRKIPFGFREIWIDGRDLKLNGKRLFLSRQSRGHNYRNMVFFSTEIVSNSAANSLRIHNQGAFYNPAQYAHYADKSGLLLIPELPLVSGTAYKIGDPGLKRRYVEMVREWKKMGRNHPSIIMWSLANEIVWGSQGNPIRMKNASNMLTAGMLSGYKSDPTRLDQFDGDWDLPPLNTAKIANLHYPWEPCNRAIAPTDCWAFLNADKKNFPKIKGFNENFNRYAEKPVIIGEFSWLTKGVMEGPKAMTIYAGDKAYDWDDWRTYRWWRKLMRWQSNAWRVARFAGLNPWYNLVDDWDDIIALETVVLQDDFRAAFSGESVNLKAWLLNDTMQAHDYNIKWQLGNKEAKSLDYSLGAGGIKSIELDISAPNCKSAKNLKLKVSLWRNNKYVNRRTYNFRVRPKIKISWPKSIALYDPSGKTAAMLKKNNIRPVIIKNLKKLNSFKGLILGRDAFEKFNDEIKRVLTKYINNGGNVMSVNSGKWPTGLLALNLSNSEFSKSNFAWVRSSGHPALSGISNADLQLWKNGDWVSKNAMQKPEQSTGILWRSLIDSGTPRGLNNSLLTEFFFGKGRILVNRLEMHKLSNSPGARALMSNLLSYLKVKSPVRNNALVYGNGYFKEILDSSGIKTSSWKPSSPYHALFIDANNGNTAKIAQWVKRGGTAFLYNLNKLNAEKWSKFVSRGFSLTPCTKKYHALIIRADKILWGVSNEELFWGSGNWTHSGGISRLMDITNSIIKIKSGTKLTYPAILVRVNDSKGSWILSTLKLNSAKNILPTQYNRFTDAIFTNLNLKAEIKNQLLLTNFKPVSLNKYVNRGFYDKVANDGKGGWTDQGDADLRFFPINLSGLDAAGLPCEVPKEFPRILKLAGVQFNIIDPRTNKGKSCLVMEPDYKALPRVTRGDYVKAAKNIKVNRRFDYLCSLHSAAWVMVDNNVALFDYVLHYEDGSVAKIPVLKGVHIKDWVNPMRMSKGDIAWKGMSMRFKNIGIYASKFKNPYPKKKVNSIDIISACVKGIPGIIAVSTADVKKQSKKRGSKKSFASPEDKIMARIDVMTNVAIQPMDNCKHPGWLKKKKNYKMSVSAHSQALYKNEWTDFKISFIPLQNGVIKKLLLRSRYGNIDAKTGKRKKIWVYADDLTVSGAKIYNGDFEEVDHKGKLKFWSKIAPLVNSKFAESGNRYIKIFHDRVCSYKNIKIQKGKMVTIQLKVREAK